jgi:hypothetical protein
MTLIGEQPPFGGAREPVEVDAFPTDADIESLAGGIKHQIAEETNGAGIQIVHAKGLQLIGVCSEAESHGAILAEELNAIGLTGNVSWF